MSKKLQSGLSYTLLIIVALLEMTFHSQAQVPAMHWVRQQGGTQGDVAYGVATNKSDLIYTTGSFSGIADFDPAGAGHQLTADADSCIYVAAHHAQGNLLWVRKAGKSGINEGYTVATGADGSVYVAGKFSGSAEFGDTPNLHTLQATTDIDAFIWKLDAQGNTLWAKNFGSHSGSDGNKIARGIATDPYGNIFVTGSDSGRIFLARMNENGDFIWSRILPGNKKLDFSNSVTASDAGIVYITGGYESDSVNMDPGASNFSIRNTGQNKSTLNLDIFVAAYDTAGAFQWANSYGGTAARGAVSPIDQAHAVHVSDSGVLLVTGVYGNLVDFNPGQQQTPGVTTLTTEANQDAFILNLDPVSGDFIWVKRLGGKQNSIDMVLLSVFAHGITTDPDENILVTGAYNGKIDFNPGIIASDTFYLRTTLTNGLDMFILKLGPAGDFVWAESYGSKDSTDFTGYARGRAITTDSFSNIYAAGYIYSKVIFDKVHPEGIMESFGERDIFLMKLNQCPDTSISYTSYKVCGLDTMIIGGRSYTKPGSYIHIHRNTAGCDSTTYFELDFFEPDIPELSVNKAEISVIKAYRSYKWYRNDTLLPNETGRTITVTKNGGYHVVILTDDDCEYASDMYHVNNVSVAHNSHQGYRIHIYPNPASDRIRIDAPGAASLQIMSLDGKILYRKPAEADIQELSLKDLSAGMYLIHLQYESGHTAVRKIIRE